MKLIAILTILFSVASANHLSRIWVVPESWKHGPSNAKSSNKNKTVNVAPIPVKWRHDPDKLIHGFGPYTWNSGHDSNAPVDAMPPTNRPRRVIRGRWNAVATGNSDEVLHVAPERGILLPPPQMTNVDICRALCSTPSADPCGLCKEVSNNPDATIPSPNAERTNTLSARVATPAQEKAWVALRHCVMQCLEERHPSCVACNEYWTTYQSTLSPTDYEDPEMKAYIEMTKCLTKCDRGNYGPACLHCEVLWNEWEQVLLPYVDSQDPATAGGVAKRGAFREDMIGMTLYRCLKGCNPLNPENPLAICLHCRNMVAVFPPTMLHNWVADRPIAKPENYHEEEGPGPG